jgi:hypothetical protein
MTKLNRQEWICIGAVAVCLVLVEGGPQRFIALIMSGLAFLMGWLIGSRKV